MTRLSQGASETHLPGSLALWFSPQGLGSWLTVNRSRRRRPFRRRSKPLRYQSPSPRSRRGRADLFRRPRHGAGLQHRRDPQPGGRQAAKRELRRRADGSRATARRSSIRDRSKRRSIRPRPRRRRTRRSSSSDAKDFARFKDLVGKGAGTQQAVDQQQAKVDALKATIEADQAGIENAETQLSYATITAPIDGRVGFRQVDAGNIVHANDPDARSRCSPTSRPHGRLHPAAA